jgi:hypothetical protein
VIIGTDKTPYLVQEKGSYYWRPNKRMRELGFTTHCLGKIQPLPPSKLCGSMPSGIATAAGRPTNYTPRSIRQAASARPTLGQ